MQGTPLLVAYEFKHEIERLLKAFPHAEHIGAGVSYKKGQEIERRWNAGEIPLLFGNPASIGHGLNMQGNRGHIAIYTETWNWENHYQFIKRLHRSGRKGKLIVYAIVAENTLDEIVATSIKLKGGNQQKFYNYLEHHLTGEQR